MNYFQRIVSGLVVKSSWDSVFLKNYDIDKLFGAGSIDKEPYKVSELVYMCISTTARAISQVPLAVMQPARKNKKGKALTDGDFFKLKMASVSLDMSKEKIIDTAIKSGELEFVDANNPWQRLFDAPNQYTDGTLLKFGLIGYILLDGNAWLLPFPSDAKMPQQLWVIPKGHLELKKDESTGHLDRWLYKPQGVQLKPIPLDPQEIVHYRLWNPYDQIMGMAPIDAGRIAMRTDFKASIYNEKFFDNSCVPDGIIYSEKPMREEQKTRTQQMAESKHQGYQRASRIMVLDKALKYERIGLTMREMNFEKLRMYNRDTIFQIFGMKKAILSVTNDLNYATDKGQTKKWWTDTNLPLMRMISSGINASPNLLAKTPYVVWWDKSAIEALQEDYKDKVDTGEKLWKMGVSFNDVNDMLELGFDKKPEHDTGYVQANLIPTNPAFRIPEETKKVIPIATEVKQIPSISEWETKAEDAWKGFAQKTERLEKLFEGKASLTFYNMRKEVLRMIYDKNKTIKATSKEQLLQDIDDYNFQKEKNLIDKASASLYEQAIKDGMATVAEELGMGIAWDIVDPAVLQYISVRRLKVTNIVNTVKRQIRGAISEGMKEGESIDDIARRIKDVFNMANKRAITIARTEVIGTTNFGRHVQMNQTSFRQRRWFTAVDDRVRPQHMAMHGKVREADKKWIMPDGSQLRYPGDYAGGASQVINCRCIEVVVKESYDSSLHFPGSERADEALKEEKMKGVVFKNTFHQKLYQKWEENFSKNFAGKTKEQIRSTFRTSMPQSIVQCLDSWQTSTNYPEAVALRMKAHQMEEAITFPRRRADMSEDKYKIVLKHLSGISDEDYIKLRAYSQAYYRKTGQKTVTLYRGTDGTNSGPAYTKKLNELKEGFASTSEFLHSEVDIMDDAICGYTSDKSIASNFGIHKGGVTVTIEVPTKNIIAPHDIWEKRRHIDEKEYIIIGGKRTIKVKDIDWSEKPTE